MQKKIRYPLALVGLFLSLFFIAACGPAERNSAGNDGAEGNIAANSNADNSIAANSAGSETESTEEDVGVVVVPANGPHFEVQSGSEMVTEAGIPAGYTVDGRPFLGDPAAPVLMEEYSDFQCPFCSRFFAQTLPALLENQIAGGEVVLVFYDFPLTSIHPQAFPASHAARCVGELNANAYWAMHDELFDNINAWAGQSNAVELFAGYAAEIGLEEDAFQECMDSGKYDEAIEEDMRLGQSLGVRSTPSFLLNGNLIAGAQPLSTFEQAIATVASGEQLASNQPQAETQPAAVPTPAAIPLDDAAGAMGDPNAPITIVEYTDYQCPFCLRHVQQTMPGLISELIETGRVYYLLKDFPLDNLHPEARQAAVAARCAGEQDAYWEMHDVVFESQAEWGGQGEAANTIFSQQAVDLGLDELDFNECLQSGKYDAAVEANFQEGSRLGVSGTPSFFIDGFPIQGAQPYDLFAYAVDLAEKDELAQAYAQPAQEQQAEPPVPSGPVEVPIDNATFAIGDPDAPVVIVEYTDFQCPFCTRHFQQTYPQILADYVETGIVRYVFKDFPLTNIHPQAVAAAEAARCAGDQGAYLEMHDLLFSRQDTWNGRTDTTTIFTEFADSLGLDTNTFSACLENHDHEEAVYADLQEGQELGVRGTPAFFINGFLLSGAQPFSTFQQAIAELAEIE
jgi:protein-disulfide isomerase